MFFLYRKTLQYWSSKNTALWPFTFPFIFRGHRASCHRWCAWNSAECYRMPPLGYGDGRDRSGRRVVNARGPKVKLWRKFLSSKRPRDIKLLMPLSPNWLQKKGRKSQVAAIPHHLPGTTYKGKQMLVLKMVPANPVARPGLNKWFL